MKDKTATQDKTPCTGNTHYQRKPKNKISQIQTTELSALWTPHQQGLEHVNLSNIMNMAEHDNN